VRRIAKKEKGKVDDMVSSLRLDRRSPTPKMMKTQKHKSRYALEDLDPDFMSLGRGHLDVLDREGFACARGEGERNEPERNDNGIIMTKYTITRVIGQTPYDI
jgi:hypothetical protein